MTADVLSKPTTSIMDGVTPHMSTPAAAKLHPSPALPGSMEAAIKMWLQVGNVQKLQQAVLDGYGWLLKDQTSRLPHVNRFLKKVPEYQGKIDAIHEQVIRGDLKAVASLLDKKGWANARDHYGHSPLHKSVMANQEEVMNWLIQNFPDHMEDRDNEGRTPLHYAAALQGTTGGLNHLFDILIESGAEENVVDVQGKTPSFYRDHPQDIRHRSVQSRKPAPVSTHLIRGDPDSATSPIPPPNRAYLRSLIHNGDLEHLEKVVLDGHGQKLLHETSALDKVTRFLHTLPDFMDTIAILHNATTAGVVPVVAELLTSERLALSRDPYGATPLHKAVLFYQPKIVKLIADKFRITTRAKDQEGRTPLHYSAALNDSGIFYRYLLKCGADEHIQDKYGKTAKFYVYSPGELDLNTLINRCKEMPRKRNPEGKPRHYSVPPEQMAKQEALLHSSPVKTMSTSTLRSMIRQADLDGLEQVVIDGHGQKLIGEVASDNRIRVFIKSVPIFMRKIEALHEAAVKGDLSTIQATLTRRKLAISKDENGLGLLHKAVYHGHRAVVDWLIEKYPETLSTKDWDGRLPLHYATVDTKSRQLFSVLVNAGADASVVDSYGNTPQYYMDHSHEVTVPDWVPKWTALPPATSNTTASPNPGRKKLERKSTVKSSTVKAKRKSALSSGAGQDAFPAAATLRSKQATVDGKDEVKLPPAVAVGTPSASSTTTSLAPVSHASSLPSQKPQVRLKPAKQKSALLKSVPALVDATT